MGFSTSVSVLVIFLGLMISAGPIYEAWSYGHDQLTEARDATLKDELALKQTEIHITSTTFTGAQVSVEATNNGSIGINTSGTTVLLDGELKNTGVTRTVKTSPSSGTWLPGETLVINVTTTVDPTRVRLVTDNGYADTVVN